MPSSVQDTPVCCVQVTRLSLQNDCYTTTLRDGEFMRFRSRLSTGMTDYLFPPTILSNPSHGACQAHSTTMFLQHRAVAPRLGRAQPLLFNGSQHQSEQTLVVSTLPQGPMREESEEKRPAAIRSEDRARTGLGWTPPPAPGMPDAISQRYRCSAAAKHRKASHRRQVNHMRRRRRRSHSNLRPTSVG